MGIELARAHKGMEDQFGQWFTRYKGGVWISEVIESGLLVVGVHTPLYLGGMFVVIGSARVDRATGDYLFSFGRVHGLDSAVYTVLAGSDRGMDFANKVLTFKGAQVTGKRGDKALKRVTSLGGTWYVQYRGNIWVSEQNPHKQDQGMNIAIVSTWHEHGRLTDIGYADRDSDLFRQGGTFIHSLSDVIEQSISKSGLDNKDRLKVVGYRR